MSQWDKIRLHDNKLVPVRPNKLLPHPKKTAEPSIKKEKKNTNQDTLKKTFKSFELMSKSLSFLRKKHFKAFSIRQCSLYFLFYFTIPLSLIVTGGTASFLFLRSVSGSILVSSKGRVGGICHFYSSSETESSFSLSVKPPCCSVSDRLFLFPPPHTSFVIKKEC